MNWPLIVLLFFSVTGFTAPPENYDFRAALERIVSRHTDVIAQQARLKQTRAKNRSTGLHLLPSLSLDLSQSVSQSRFDSTGQSTRQIQANTNTNLFSFGADSAKAAAADAEEAQQSQLLRNAILEAESEGVASLIAYVKAKKDYDTASKKVALQGKARTIAQKRFKKGLMARQEVDKISVDLENARARLNDIEIQTENAAAALYALLGSKQVLLDWPWITRFQGGFVMKTQLSDVRQIPSWKAAEKAVEQAERSIDEDWSRMLPSLDANANVGYGQGLTDHISGPTWGVGLTLSIPIFDRLQDYGTYRSKVHAKTVAEAKLEKIRRSARQKYEAAKAAFRISLGSAKQRDATLVTSTKLFQVNLTRFRKGLIDANDLMVDQTRLFDSELFQTAGWSAVHLTYVDLCHSVGRRLNECLGAPPE